MFNNRLDDLVDTSNKEDVISCYQTRNATSPWLSNTKRNRVADYFKTKKEALRRNKVADHSKIKEEATKKNRITGHSKKREKLENINKDMSKVSFLN